MIISPFFFALALTAASPGLPAIDTPDLRNLLAKEANLVLVDVRPAAQFDLGHLPFAVNYPWVEDKRSESRSRLERLLRGEARPVVVYGADPLELSEVAKWIDEHNQGPVFIYLAGASGWSKYEGGFLEIGWNGLLTMLTRQSPVVLDVRDDAQFKTGHIPGARQVEPRKDWDAYLNEPEALGWKNSKRPIITYCTGVACGASRGLAVALSKAGFQEVYQFPGGYEEWEENAACLWR